MFSKQSVIFFVLTFVIAADRRISAYTPAAKDSIFADVLLTELLNRMDTGNNYFDSDNDMSSKIVDLVARPSKNNLADDYEYRNMFGGSSNPSLRDQEFLQHSSLWGHQFVSGGMGEGPNRFNSIVKSDASLPAYCNPPNPCPYGYEEIQGCISDFENTAIFSREFQAAQECTCDSEHMFDCAGQDSSVSNNEMNSAMEKFLLQQFQNDNAIDNGNPIVKKNYGFEKHQDNNNPFLQGDKLPIAAKKGDHIFN